MIKTTTESSITIETAVNGLKYQVQSDVRNNVTQIIDTPQEKVFPNIKLIRLWHWMHPQHRKPKPTISSPYSHMESNVTSPYIAKNENGIQ